MSFYKGKRILVAGGTGLIGTPLVERLVEKGAQVRIASLDPPSISHPQAEFYQLNLTSPENCLKVCEGMEFVFNLLCEKGSPKRMRKEPATVLDNMLLFNTHLIQAARKSGAKKYLYTSTYGVYFPAEILNDEVDIFNTPLSENDRFAGGVKRIGELQAQAQKLQYNWEGIHIVRPSNIYGPFDNFNPNKGAMVVPTFIKKVVDKEDPIVCWGDGSNRRDFMHARDCADAMLLVVEEGFTRPINLGYGKAYTTKELLDTILQNADYSPQVIWDASKQAGDKHRVVTTSQLESLGFKPQIPLEQGIRETMRWYQENQQ
jgi:GDP-L-fucose synthase